ncbi:MAG: hypothetical protein CR965_00695 [Paludibacter sp.]|nr:MAG: hypothetical protein CR965_00695 [Paludibacter sp.]
MGLGFAKAQSKTEDLQIDKVFSNFWEAKNSVKVELDFQDSEGYYYKSLVTENNPEAISFAKTCIKKDKKEAQKVKEVYAEGKLATIYLTLSTKGEFYRFILFNDNGKGKMTLVYIESENKDILKIILKKQ